MEQGTIYLKIKLKNLADEAKVIRHEEHKVRGDKKKALQDHRKGIVRTCARSTLLAYAFLRGVPYDKVEPFARTKPDMKDIQRMVRKYGTPQAPNHACIKKIDAELERWFGEMWNRDPYIILPKRHKSVLEQAA